MESAQRGLQGHQEKTGSPETTDNQELTVTKALMPAKNKCQRPLISASAASRQPRDLPEEWDQKDLPGLPVPMDSPENKDKEALRDRPARQEHQERMDNPARKDNQALQGKSATFPGPWG